MWLHFILQANILRENTWLDKQDPLQFSSCSRKMYLVYKYLLRYSKRRFLEWLFHMCKSVRVIFRWPNLHYVFLFFSVSIVGFLAAATKGKEHLKTIFTFGHFFNNFTRFYLFWKLNLQLRNSVILSPRIVFSTSPTLALETAAKKFEGELFYFTLFPWIHGNFYCFNNYFQRLSFFLQRRIFIVPPGKSHPL